MKTRRKTKIIIVHCSATPPRMDVGVTEIRRWHIKRGFSAEGYHFVIRRDGTLEHGREAGKIGAHTRGHNHESIGICLIGGVDDDNRPENNFTDAQFETLDSLISALHIVWPEAEVRGHRDFDSGKDCPSFAVEDWLRLRLATELSVVG